MGGKRGGGKSDALIGRHYRGATKWGPAWNGLIVRQKYKEFKELRRRIDELKRMGMPIVRSGGENQINEVRFENGAVVTMAAIGRLSIADDFIGMQFTEISIDEAPKIAFIAPLMDKLKGSLRSPHGVPCHMFLTGNPGGPGSSMIKVMFIPKEDGGSAPVAANKVNLITRTLDDGSLYKFSRVFIRSGLEDNRILMRNDPNYVNLLRSIRDPNLRAAWLDGRWDVFIGQAFDFGAPNIIKPIWPVPEHAPVYMTFDWGYGAPSSFGWWWVDADNRVYRFAEWYTQDPERDPNTGMRLTDEQLAKGVIDRERVLGISDRTITRFCDPTCFNKKPNYMGGGQGPSTAEVFHQLGLTLRPGDADRKLKIRRFRSRLQSPSPGELPMLVVYDTCTDFIRIIPSLCISEINREDLESEQEDHPYDEACHICMARPHGVTSDEESMIENARAEKAKMKALDVPSREASLEFQRLKQEMLKGAHDDIGAFYDDDEDFQGGGNERPL